MKNILLFAGTTEGTGTYNDYSEDAGASKQCAY